MNFSKYARAFIATLLMVCSIPFTARGAEDDNRVTSELSTGLTIIGPTKHVTGGFTLRGSADYGFAFSGRVQVALGADFAVFGMGGGPRAIGFFGGPTVRVVGRPWDNNWHLYYTTAFDFGRFPQCNLWEHPICMRYIGFDPSFKVGAFYKTGAGMSVGGFALARVIPNFGVVSIAGEFGMTISFVIEHKKKY